MATSPPVAAAVSTTASPSSSSSSSSSSPEWPSISQFYAGRDIFVTGATGFLGKCLVEKLIRSVPDIGKVMVLVRPKRGKTVQERIETVLSSKVSRKSMCKKVSFVLSSIQSLMRWYAQHCTVKQQIYANSSKRALDKFVQFLLCSSIYAMQKEWRSKKNCAVQIYATYARLT